VSDESQGDLDEQRINHSASSGLYVYDIAKLLQGRIEKYKIAKAIGGICNHVDNSMFSDRFSFVQDYNNIVVVPFPHLNHVNCVGMAQKHEYLMWRQKNGFFTALDKQGELLTWSLLSGKLLYIEDQNNTDQMENERAGSKNNCKGYEVYRADEKDITYTRNFYN